MLNLELVLLFLLIGWFSWRNGHWVLKHTKPYSELGWARDLAAMLQVTLVGYASAGAFLGLAYFDFYYHIVALMVLTRWITEKTLAEGVDSIVKPAKQAKGDGIYAGDFGAGKP